MKPIALLILVAFNLGSLVVKADDAGVCEYYYITSTTGNFINRGVINFEMEKPIITKDVFGCVATAQNYFLTAKNTSQYIVIGSGYNFEVVSTGLYSHGIFVDKAHSKLNIH